MPNTIESITVHSFEQHGAARHPGALMHVEELELYAALDGWYLGVVCRDRHDNDYSFAVLGPDPVGAKRWIGGADSIKSIDEARTKLHEELGQFAAKGKRVHQQD